MAELHGKERAGFSAAEAVLSFLTILWAANPVSPKYISSEVLRAGGEGNQVPQSILGAPEWGPKVLFFCMQSKRAPAFLPRRPAMRLLVIHPGQRQELHSGLKLVRRRSPDPWNTDSDIEQTSGRNGGRRGWDEYRE